MSDVFVPAVGALYGTDQESRRKADTWLTELKHAPQAWQVVTEVMGRETAAEVIFIAADMMHSKARAEWRKLGGETAGAVLACVRCVFAYSSPLTTFEPCCCMDHSGHPSLDPCVVRALASRRRAGHIAMCELRGCQRRKAHRSWRSPRYTCLGLCSEVRLCAGCATRSAAERWQLCTGGGKPYNERI